MTNEEIMNVVKPAICAQLKSPSSAQFPVNLISITGNDTNGYKISGFVDSQNSYGAMIRNDFTAEVSIKNGQPTVTYALVGVKTTVNNAKQFGINYLAITIVTVIGGFLLYGLISLIVGM